VIKATKGAQNRISICLLISVIVGYIYSTYIRIVFFGTGYLTKGYFTKDNAYLFKPKLLILLSLINITLAFSNQ
jgi:hypothetical protein